MDVPPRAAPTVAILLGLLFVFFAVVNLVRASYVNSGIGGAIGAVLVFAGAIGLQEQRANERFLEWLADEMDDIDSGHSFWTRDTPVIRYRGVVALIVISFEFASRYGLDEPPDGHSATLGPPSVGPLLTAVTLLLGWFSFPLGPARVIGLLKQNRRRGGETLGDVIAEIRDDGYRPGGDRN